MTQTPAGWYPNPEMAGTKRWWDGSAWTPHIVTDFSGVDAARLSKAEARSQVAHLQQSVHRLEELINRHGLRTALDVENWVADQRASIEQENLTIRAKQSQADDRLAEADRVLAQSLAEARQASTEILARAEQEATVRKDTILGGLSREREAISQEIEELSHVVVAMRESAPLHEVGYFDYEHPAEASTELATELEALRNEIKSMLRDKKASSATTNLTFEGSAAKGRQLINGLTKVLLRAYNAEAENALKATKAGNLDTAQARLSRAADQIAKNGQMVNMRITSDFHRLRLKEIELAHRHMKALQREKELERERREELREQRRVEQELRREQERLEKEKAHYLAALQTLQSNGDEDAVARMRAKLEDVERAITDVDYRTANIRAGYVYVISNLGSFGADVVKIGMTRRLDPMDRVRELGDASVPFKFDVHALFFAEDAVGVESMLHREFTSQRINQVNLRREYFQVNPSAVLDVLKQHNVEVLEFNVEPEAEEYRTSQSIRTEHQAGSAVHVG